MVASKRDLGFLSNYDGVFIRLYAGLYNKERASADHNLLLSLLNKVTSVDSVTWQSLSCRPSFVSNYLRVAFFGLRVGNMTQGNLKVMERKITYVYSETGNLDIVND